MARHEGERLNEPLQIGQFAIVGHEAQERGATIGIAEENGRGEARAELFALAEGTTPAANEFAGHLVAQAERTWKAIDLSLTGGLIAIYSEAQRSLREWNTRGTSQHRVGLGLACLARQGDRFVLATRGPASILRTSGATLTIYEPDAEHAEPMDGLETGQPQLTSLTLAPGDRVLLVTTNITEALGEDLLGSILAQSLGEVLPNLYRRITHLRDAAVLLVGVTEAGDQALPLPEPPAVTDLPDDEGPVIGGEAAAVASEAPDFQPSLFTPSGPEDVELEQARKQISERDARSRTAGLSQDLPAAFEILPLAKAVGDGAIGRQFPPVSRSATSGARPFHEVTRARQGPPPTLASHHTNAPPVSQLAADRRAELTSFSASAAPTAIPIPAPGARTAGSGSVIRVRSTMGGSRRGGGGGRGGDVARRFAIPPRLLIVAGAIALIALVVWTAMPGLTESGGEERLSELLAEAEREMTTASVVDRADQRRESLIRAQGILLEAAELDGGRVQTAPLLERVARELAALDAIIAPNDIRPLADLRDFGETALAPRQLVIGGGFAYVLDSRASQVIGINLSTGATSVIVTPGEATPLAPVRIAYAGEAQVGGATLLIADATGSLWAWSSVGWVAEMGFARPDGLTITDMSFTGEALFVLDAPAGAIYRFAATPSGFDSPPTLVRQAAELTAASHLQAEADGVIFTTDANGTVHRIDGEFTLMLTQSGIDQPLAAGATPHTQGLAGEIALLDASADRIVILGRDGAFLRQYQHTDLENLTAFTMYEGYGYVISDEQLRRITF